MDPRDGLPRLTPVFPRNRTKADTTIDIIAVHGIETHSPQTWTAYQRDEEPRGRAVNWLCDEDMLPSIIPSARIWVYDYNSNCYSDNAQEVDILGLGEVFLETLCIETDQGIGQRPLIFIGSCFGGIVVVQALERADRDHSDKYKSLLESIGGIIFLGTPLRGTATASVAQWIAGLRGFLGKETSRTLLRSLEDNGTDLNRIVKDFSRMVIRRSFQIRCFYETRLTQIANAVVKKLIANLIPNIQMLLVSKESACLDGHKEIALDARHAMMNKFRGPEDGNFRLVAKALKDLADSTMLADKARNRRILTKEESECLQSLTSDYRADKDRNERRVPGTCEWVLSHPKFLDWRKNEEASLLWVSADPGCGKSVLSRALIDDGLLSPQASICYFFFKDDDANRQSDANALSAILHRLFVQKPALLKYAMPEYEINGLSLRTMFSTMWEILEKAAKDPEAGEIICILDALDECKESSERNIIRQLGHFYSKWNTNAKLKFLITSRPYIGIESEFIGAVPNMESNSLKDEEESEKISEEIDKVIPYEIWRISRARKHPFEKKVKDALILKLQSIPHQTYLWLHLILDVIRKSLDSSQFRLERLIDSLPESVEDAYEKILMRVEDKGQARRLLHIVVAAKTPLKIEEANIALTIDEALQAGQTYTSFEELPMEPEASFRDKLRNLCGLFVSIKDTKLYLIHQTAREFLISKDRIGTLSTHTAHSTSWKHSFKLTQSDFILTQICMSYLMFKEINQVVLEFEGYFPTTIKYEIYRNNFPTYSFLCYAAENWGFHFQQAKIVELDERMLQSALDICDIRSNRFNNWYSFSRCECLPSTPLAVACCSGLELCVQRLLEKQDRDLHPQNQELGMSLIFAVEHEHEEIVKLLLHQEGIEINFEDSNNETPLSIAVASENVEIVKLLLEKKDLEMNCHDYEGYTPLSRAVENRSVKITKLLLQRKDIEVNCKDYRHETPLAFAARNGEVEVVRLLLDKGGIKVNCRNIAGETPLSEAARNGKWDIVRLLLAKEDIQVNCKDKKDRTPLAFAVIMGEVEVVRLLLDKDGIEVNCKNVDGYNPLWYAADYGRAHVVQLLLEKGAEFDPGTEIGQELLASVTEKGYTEILNLLQSRQSVSTELASGNISSPEKRRAS